MTVTIGSVARRLMRARWKLAGVCLLLPVVLTGCPPQPQR